MASKQITQETFDAVVKENMEEFEMSSEEAVQDAVQQFESQGVNLANIIKDIHIGNDESGAPGKHPILLAVDGLAEGIKAISSGGDAQETKAAIMPHLDTFKVECDKDLAHRLQAAGNQAYPTLLLLVQCRLAEADLDFQCRVLDCLCSLLNGQPDLMTSDGMDFVLGVLQRAVEAEEGNSQSQRLQLAVRAVRLACVKHETNRQTFVKRNLIGTLIKVLSENKDSVKVVKEVDATFRTLVVDDDIRVPFGKAHDHAKMIVEEGALKLLLEVMQTCMHDQGVVGDLCATLARLSVRNEFCQEIVNLGGLKAVLAVLGDDQASQLVVKQLLALVKAIAGNDEVKTAIVNAGGIPTILGAISRFIRQPQVCEAGCGAVAAIVLRKPANCTAVMEAEGAKLLVQVLGIHGEEAGVQKQACMAVRNLVARTRQYSEAFIQLGIEPLLRGAQRLCPDEAKAALRDLDLKVELRELWKGEKTPLTH
ncbi:armadillo repeat-containing protein 6-like [Diadema setosum]|uniref:armadillo repeat-containing protein 6-like n=1 Tax=Diadema setosum TaxID=31175 RepID=UPI003B3B0050